MFLNQMFKIGRRKKATIVELQHPYSKKQNNEMIGNILFGKDSIEEKKKKDDNYKLQKKREKL